MPVTTLKSSVRHPLVAKFSEVRELTNRLCQPLEPDDYLLQSMPDCSPPKWHLAHTTWFFETFILAIHEPEYRPHHPQFTYLFNSYYDAVGDRWPRPSRGLLSRPTVPEVYEYRQAVNERIVSLLEQLDGPIWEAVAPVLELGINHEEQHQELLLTDLKHAFGLNPLRPVYASHKSPQSGSPCCVSWEPHSAGVRRIGHPEGGFAFDNEGPEHHEYIHAFRIASRCVNVEEFLEFIEDGGYDRPDLWLSDGWAACQRHGWAAPLYWNLNERTVFTLSGQRPLEMAEPVCHISFYEADAFARWAGARLPTEAEWETAVATRKITGNFLDSARYHPIPGDGSGQFFGDVWEWTCSPYVAYPGYRPVSGALGEYNSKFMCNQMVLRGGSCVTPANHIRPTYRNFFPPDARWQFSGLRLAKEDNG